MGKVFNYQLSLKLTTAYIFIVWLISVERVSGSVAFFGEKDYRSLLFKTEIVCDKCVNLPPSANDQVSSILALVTTTTTVELYEYIDCDGKVLKISANDINNLEKLGFDDITSSFKVTCSYSNSKSNAFSLLDLENQNQPDSFTDTDDPIKDNESSSDDTEAVYSNQNYYYTNTTGHGTTAILGGGALLIALVALRCILLWVRCCILAEASSNNDYSDRNQLVSDSAIHL